MIIFRLITNQEASRGDAIKTFFAHSPLATRKRWKPADLWKCFLPPRAPPPFDIYKSIKIIWYFFHRKYFFRHRSVSKGGDLWRSKKIIRDDTAGSRMKNNAIILLRERENFLYWQVNTSGAERPRHSVYVCKQHRSKIIFLCTFILSIVWWT